MNLPMLMTTSCRRSSTDLSNESQIPVSPMQYRRSLWASPPTGGQGDVEKAAAWNELANTEMHERVKRFYAGGGDPV